MIQKRLRIGMAEDGRSVYQIAKDTGIDYSTLCRFFKGKVGLSVGALERLAATLGLAMTRPGTEESKAPKIDPVKNIPTKTTPSHPEPSKKMSDAEINRRKKAGIYTE